MHPIHLIAAVPGSGKTHIIDQLGKDSSLTSKYIAIHHDDYKSEMYRYPKVLAQAAKYGDCPVIGECPFRASVLEAELKALGCEVRVHYLLEPLALTIQRYQTRSGKPFSKAFETNWHKYSLRSPRYTQIELLKALQEALKA